METYSIKDLHRVTAPSIQIWFDFFGGLFGITSASYCIKTFRAILFRGPGQFYQTMSWLELFFSINMHFSIFASLEYYGGKNAKMGWLRAFYLAHVFGSLDQVIPLSINLIFLLLSTQNVIYIYKCQNRSYVKFYSRCYARWMSVIIVSTSIVMQLPAIF